MTPARCFLHIRGRWYALMNWKAHGTRGDAVVLRALHSDEEERLRALREEEVDEITIFERLFPSSELEAPTQDVRLPITLLTKAQLAYLIQRRLGISIPTLTKMYKEDLMRLFGRL